MADRVRGPNWCFTWNNFTSVTGPSDVLLQHKHVPVYLVWQHEVSSTGTPHLQGYVVFDKPVSLLTLTRALPGVHFERRMAKTHREAIEYVTSTGKHADKPRVAGPWTVGEKPTDDERRKRKDIDHCLDMIKQGKTPRLLLQDDDTASAYIKYMPSMDKARVHLGAHQRTVQTCAMIYWGPPHTGKTHAAEEWCRKHSLTFYVCPQQQATNGNPWFDGYNSEDVVIVNEMGGHWCRPEFYCNLIDKSAMKVQFKGGSYDFVSKMVIFTSNRDPTTWWSQLVMDKNPGLLRRLTQDIDPRVNICRVVYFPLSQVEVVRREVSRVTRPDIMALADEKLPFEELPVEVTSPMIFRPEQAYAAQTADIVASTHGVIRDGFISTSDDLLETLAATAESTTMPALREQADYGLTQEGWIKRQRYIYTNWRNDPVARRRSHVEFEDGSTVTCLDE